MDGAHRRKLKRIDLPRHGRYLTFSCYRRMPLLNNDRIKDAFVDHLAFVRKQMDFQLLAWVVMPEHVHLLVLPGKASVTAILRRLKAPFAKQILARWRALDAPVLPQLIDAHGEHRFWQRGGGYDRKVVSEAVVHQTIDYIHANPVRRQLVHRVTDWRRSSSRWYAGKRRNGPTIDRLRL